MDEKMLWDWTLQEHFREMQRENCSERIVQGALLFESGRQIPITCVIAVGAYAEPLHKLALQLEAPGDRPKASGSVLGHLLEQLQAEAVALKAEIRKRQETGIVAEELARLARTYKRLCRVVEDLRQAQTH